MVFEAIKILLPPILAAIFGGYLVNRFKSREDAIDKRLDELYSEIRLAATDAENYWKSDPKADDLKILAAKTLAAIVRLDGLRSAIAKHMSQSASDEMAAAASDFMRLATGGEFGVHNRESDIFRAAQVHQQAAAFSVAVRKARLQDLEGWRRRS